MPITFRILLAVAATFFATAGRAQDKWTPFPQDATRENLWSIAYGARTLVVAGEHGTIISYSYDDQAWLPRVSGSNVWLVGTGFGASRFIVVGDQGTILTSDDAGVTWTPRTSGTTTRLNAVAYGNNRWLIVGEQGVVLTSADGNTWTSRPALSTGFLRALAYGQGQFLIGGAGGALFSTTDAVTFTPVPLTTTYNIEGAAISAAHFWIVGSAGLRASATQLGNWTFNFNGPTATFRGVTVRNSDEASAVGESTADTFTLAPTPGWRGYFDAPQFLATAVVQGADEVVCVGFGGSVARSVMNSPAAIVSDAGNYTAFGSDVHLQAVSGQPSLSYQWRRNGSDLPGATQAALTLAHVTTADAAQYDVRITPPSGASSLTGTVLVRLMPAGRPEVRDTIFAPALSSFPYVTARQPDGKTIVAGSFTVNVTGGPTYGLARLNADSSIDSGFRAGDGIPVTQSIAAIHLLADGRLYVRGSFTVIAGQARDGLARLMSNGAIDPSFNPDPAIAKPSNSVLAPDGRVYVQNYSGNTTTVSRLNLDGSIDATFPRLADSTLVGVDSKGRLLVVTSASGASATLVRYLVEGTRDSGYTPTNVAFNPIGWGTILAVARLTDTGLYYASSYIGGHFGSIVTFNRMLPDGGRDTTYVSPPQSDYPAIPRFSSAYRSDGGLWQVRTIDGGTAYRALSFTPGGTPDNTRYATLPDFSHYYILNVADDGSLLAYNFDSTKSSGVNFFRVRPLVGRPGRLTNLSVRAFVPPSSDPLIAGFVTTGSGSGSTRALVRGVGPTLASFGVSDAMRDPNLSLVRDSLTQTSNDNWPATLASRFTAVGAFALPVGSADAALEADVGAGNYTGVVTPAAGDGGTALVELFDSSGVDNPSRRFVNVSARGRVESGRPLIVGFTITGDVPATVLVRGIGPALTSFGVGGALADPKLTLYRGTAAIWENTWWLSNQAPGTPPDKAATSAGAFALDVSKKDTAMVVTLAPGSYTATVTSQADAAGTALVEVYEVP